MSLRKKTDGRQRLPAARGKTVQGAKRDRPPRERLEVLAPGDFTTVPREDIAPGYKSKRLKFLLVKPGGRPYMIAHTAWLCFVLWCKEENILLLNDATEDEALKKFRKSGWKVCNAEVIAIVGTEVKNIEDSEL